MSHTLEAHIQTRALISVGAARPCSVTDGKEVLHARQEQQEAGVVAASRDQGMSPICVSRDQGISAICVSREQVMSIIVVSRDQDVNTI